MVKLSPDLRERLGRILPERFYNFCLQCGACVSDCPGHLYVEEFNPRDIILGIILGQRDELIGPDSMIWNCTNCYTCYERCPQDVRPIEVIIALKNVTVQDGKAPKELDALLRTVRRTGRAFPMSGIVSRRREELGLCEIPAAPMREIRKLEGSGDGDGESPDAARRQEGDGDSAPSDAARGEGSS